MNDGVSWSMKLLGVALVFTPLIGATGCALINYWYGMKAKFIAVQIKALSESLKAIAEKMERDNTPS